MALNPVGRYVTLVEAHVSEARHEAPDLVVKLRPGPPPIWGTHRPAYCFVALPAKICVVPAALPNSTVEPLAATWNKIGRLDSPPLQPFPETVLESVPLPAPLV